MTEYMQLHGLVAYPASNLNRDDLNRPKTVMIGRSMRLRVSSQSLKRAWRMSEPFVNELDGAIGIRTKELGTKIFESLVLGKSLQDTLAGNEETSRDPVNEKVAKGVAIDIIKVFGDIEKSEKDEASIKTKQLVHFSRFEIDGIDEIIKKVSRGDDFDISKEQPRVKDRTSVDIGMFGRMIAGKPGSNFEAAVQVAHAHTVHSVAVEDDYFSAVDDLNDGSVSSGAAYLADTSFGAGLFYIYICINRDLIIENLGGDRDLADKTISALVRTVSTVSPRGKQNSFASRAYVSYLLMERGSQQPRSLSVAFLKPLDHSGDLLEDAIMALKDTRDRLDTAYGQCYGDCAELDTYHGIGNMDSVLALLRK